MKKLETILKEHSVSLASMDSELKLREENMLDRFSFEFADFVRKQNMTSPVDGNTPKIVAYQIKNDFYVLDRQHKLMVHGHGDYRTGEITYKMYKK